MKQLWKLYYLSHSTSSMLELAMLLDQFRLPWAWLSVFA